MGFKRYKANQASIIPYPFKITKQTYSSISSTAPILIVGDSMGKRLTMFKDRLAAQISKNLSSPIKIDSLAHEGDNIHRTLKKLESLKKTPLIIIYIGNQDETYEYLFESKYLKKITENFKLYQNDYIKTALMIAPTLSRVIYEPIKYVWLGEKIDKDETSYDDQEFQKRTAMHYTLYQEGIYQLFDYVKKRNALIIPLTTPINLKRSPRKSCYGSFTADAKTQVKSLIELIKSKDFKSAYNLSNELALTNPYNSKINYLHSKVLRKLNQFKKAQKYAELSHVYDCAHTGANPVYNSILKKASSKYRYEYLDFHQQLVDESQDNYVFLDETYPQDVFFEQIVDALAYKIKKRLKL